MIDDQAREGRAQPVSLPDRSQQKARPTKGACQSQDAKTSGDPVLASGSGRARLASGWYPDPGRPASSDRPASAVPGIVRNEAWRLASRLTNVSTSRAVLLSAALVALVTLIDLVTPVELNMAVFYFAPVAVAAWLLGRDAGIGFAAAAALMTLLNERLGGFPYSHPMYFYWALGVRFLSFGVVAWVVARLRASYAEIRDLARFDPLTNVANRRGFYDETERALHRARRSGAPLSLLYLDVDNFKQVNDTVGHLAGDDLLREVARLMSSTRATDTAARLGGDEFVVLMPDTAANAANEVVNRLQQSFQNALASHWNVTFSMGLVTFIVPPASADQIIRCADNLMYSVKRDTKNALRCLVVENPIAIELAG
jgi:diguanylate cyclase (GGDEF)-like protein